MQQECMAEMSLENLCRPWRKRATTAGIRGSGFSG